jgi:nicotinate phosphoribosyltransferase
VIDSIRDEGGRVDIYGVGTRLVTCDGDGGGALGGVYKLVRSGDRPRLKVTSDTAKATLPDRKRLLRALAPDGSFIQDVISLDSESIVPGDTVFDPANPLQYKTIPVNAQLIDLRDVVMTDGKAVLGTSDNLNILADRTADQLQKLPQGTLRFMNPHRYKISISKGLLELRQQLVKAIQEGSTHG